MPIKVLKKIRYMILSSVIIVMIGCEDDPVLGPQISECAPGDSYCDVSIREEEEDSKSNPEIF
tara:strand:- start:1115 stop:1303 length:189 start_codon:yes stop_codon:yes gene_type:complete